MQRSRFVVVLSLLLTVALSVAFLPTLMVRADPVGFVWSATKTSIVNDGTDSSTITLTVTDNSAPIADGTQITFTVTPADPGITVTPSLVVATSGGTAAITIKTTSAVATVPTIHVNATAGTPCVTNCASPQFDLTVLDAALPNQAKSTISASPASIAADGTTQSLVTITLKNSVDTPIQGVTLALTPSVAGPTVAPAAAGTDTTNASGVATFNVSWLNAELAASQAINFVTGSIPADAGTFTLTTSITFTTPALPSQGPSNVIASPTSILANNTATSMVSVTLLNAANAPVVGKTVSLTQTTALGGVTITPTQPVTNASGVATFTVQGTTAGTATFLATDTTDNIPLNADTVTVTLVSPLPAEAPSTVSAVPTLILANNTATSTVTVTLLTALNTPVQGKTVTLTETTAVGGITITPAQAVTDANGVATFTVKGTNVGTATFKATDTSDTIELPNDLVNITLVSPLPAEAQSTVSAAPASIAADGLAPSTVTVTLLTAANTPVQGKTVTLTQTTALTNITISPAQAVTDANGVATFTVKGTTIGTATFKATDTSDNIDLVNDLVTITLTAPPANKTTSTVVLSKSVVIANNTDLASITVALKDAAGNPVTNKTVSIQVDVNPSGITVNGQPYPWTSLNLAVDNMGVATFLVRSNIAIASAKFTVIDVTDGLLLDDAADVATVQFIAPGADKNQSQVFVDKTSIFANGVDTATVSVQVRDVTGFPIPNKSVSLFSISFPSGVLINDQPALSSTSKLTNGNGIATFTVKSTSIASNVTLVFRVDSDSLVLDDTADVPVLQFTPPVPTNTPSNTPTLTPTGPTPTPTLTLTPTSLPSTSAALSTVACDYTQAPADGQFKVTISIVLRDQNSNPVANHLPVPSVIPATAGLSFSSPALTDSTGRVTYYVSSVTQTAPNAILVSVTDTTASPNVILAQTCTIIFGAAGSTPVVGATPIGGLTLTPIGGTITVTPSRTTSPLVNAADQGPITGVVVAYRLRVRTGPGLNYDILGLLKYKVTIVLLGRNRAGTWLLTQLDDGRQVWVSSRWIKISRARFRRLPLIDVPTRTPVIVSPSSYIIPSGGQGVGTANVAMLNAYDAPSATAKVVGVLPRGTQMLILGKSEDGNWYYVQADADKIWVPATYVSLSKINGSTLGIIAAGSS